MNYFAYVQGYLIPQLDRSRELGELHRGKLQYGRLIHYLLLGNKLIQNVDGEKLEYDGELDGQGNACGSGKYTQTQDKKILSKYKGTFLNDMAEGKGVLEDKRGNTFDGEFRGGRLHGNIQFCNAK